MKIHISLMGVDYPPVPFADFDISTTTTWLFQKREFQIPFMIFGGFTSEVGRNHDFVLKLTETGQKFF